LLTHSPQQNGVHELHDLIDHHSASANKEGGIWHERDLCAGHQYHPTAFCHAAVLEEDLFYMPKQASVQAIDEGGSVLLKFVARKLLCFPTTAVGSRSRHAALFEDRDHRDGAAGKGDDIHRPRHACHA
jgi:hypothetical protein